MPAIYDNIETPLVDGLRGLLAGARAADFCVGYFNLRGWGKIAEEVDNLPDGCRLLIGMSGDPRDVVRRAYTPSGGDGELTQQQAAEQKNKAVAHIAEQLTYGCPTAADEKNLNKLAAQLQNKKVQVKFHARYPLHAKLYLVRRADAVAARAGVVGSSNLTLAGLQKNGELNIDVLEQDAANKLQQWFADRWEDEWSVDISAALADIIKTSWAGGAVPPYHIYLKTAWHLSQDAVRGAAEYSLPLKFRGKMLDFQARGVELAAALLHKQGGVIIGDVVGLGKTIVASAVAKTCQERDGDNVLVICPPKLQKMWEEYLHEYLIAGDVLPHSRLRELEAMRRYKLLVIDESHNFRNRESKRFACLRDYIERNESRAVLLTATPYNKAFGDIAAQLRLFLPPDKDLGVRPDNAINAAGGAAAFRARHPDIPPSSLAAFEQSADMDDWRELMRLFMVRRTRAHIKEHYAEVDKKTRRHYLLFPDGARRFDFPDRKPLSLPFPLDAENSETDDYAKLYSPAVVGIIGGLRLPRYGLAVYRNKKPAPPGKVEQIIKNLTRAGPRLRGFTRSGLFKRLESGGDAFLLSISRHILRNEIYIAALAAEGGALPVGQIDAAETEEAADEAELPLEESAPKVAEAIYKWMRQNREEKYGWIGREFFDIEKLRADLQTDVDNLQKIRKLVPQWNAAKDRKLQALRELVQTTHGEEKVLIFSQYKDTVEYIHRELSASGVANIAAVHGGSDDAQDIVGRFSPRSNGKQKTPGDFRVLVATDSLSEGQNLQDAHIIVNYDLPWALIRLVQRAGRIDRIGQASSEIICYSAMPEDGVNRVINLRTLLKNRIAQNAELVGSDERFFEGDEATDQQQLQGLYNGGAKLEEKEDETDLTSRAYDIWQRAEKQNPKLAAQIRNLPNVAYSAKAAANQCGVAAYMRDGRGHDILARVNEAGEILSQSQTHILKMLECAPNTPAARPAANHHEVVSRAVAELQNNIAALVGGQLGGKNAVRRRLFNWLQNNLAQAEAKPLLFSPEEKLRLNRAAQDVYDRPLTEQARAAFRQLFRENANDDKKRATLAYFCENGALCFNADGGGEVRAPQIICSMGFVK